MRQTNGVEADYGLGLVWPLERIVNDNLLFRSSLEFRELYMPFDPLLFFADAGNGDQFAFLWTPRRDEVFWWDHETDSRQWVAPFGRMAPDRAHSDAMSQMRKRVAIVGAGWAGAVTAERLSGGGVDVEVFERAANVGGHSRSETLNGVVYEPNGAHIFHTSHEDVAGYVQRFGLSRRYEHCVKAQVHLGDDDTLTLLSWPPQLEELRELELWPTIEKELAALPDAPSGEDFETFVMSLMGPTLYNLFIRDYTAKQWGRPATELSSSFAPKRVELRDDGYRRLFRDRWEFFSATGINSVIEAVLAKSSVTCGAELLIDDLVAMQSDFDAFIVTAPLDRLLGRDGELEWRGVHLRSRYMPVERPEETSTPAYVVNWPDLRYPFTRTIETKHATGQQVMGTVVSEEYPGAPARHYPVPTVDRRFEALNDRYKDEVRKGLDRPVYFCGRLANYLYINQDQAIEQGFACSAEVLGDLSGSSS